MATFDADLQARIADACRKFDRPAALEHARELEKQIRASHRAFGLDEVKDTLKVLRRNRYFDEVLVVAEAVMESGERAEDVRVAYAQALIDTERLEAALGVLAGMTSNEQASGLVGRVHKQLFVNGGGEPALRDQRLSRAFDVYYEAYSADATRYWHGINAVALQARAKREEKNVREVAPFAETIERFTLGLGDDDFWAVVTAGEAALALREYEKAIARYAKFAMHPGVGAFEIYSALRQLIEVWQLSDDREPGSTLLPLLRSAYLERSGSQVAMGGAELRRDVEAVKKLEKAFGNTMFKTLKWYRTGLDRCNPVCRINDASAQGIGTGFLVRGNDFHPDLGDEKLVLTNAHVVSNTFPGALLEGEGIATFEALAEPDEYALDEIVWTDSELDATLVRCTSKALPGCGPYELAKRMPANDEKQRVYVIGHPNGGGLTLSLNDNVLLDYDDKYAHYRAPTEGGSSGSPVFNSDWKLIALHHYGDFATRRLNGKPGVYEANEGILLSRIVAASRAASVKRA
jgi:S1-C subfamily serine protease